jgi:hypothetical protein
VASRVRGRVVLGIALAAVVAAAGIYVSRTTDDGDKVGSGLPALSAFGDHRALATDIRRAWFSPDGNRLAAVGEQGVGLVQGGRLAPLTAGANNVVDAAWMPDSRGLLVIEGPTEADQLSVLGVDGRVTGVAHLDRAVSPGDGYGIGVDRRGARAVVVTETRDTIGGRRHRDLLLVDLPTGRTSDLVITSDADETNPFFVGDDAIVFGRARDGRARVVQRDLASGAEKFLTAAADDVTPIGVIADDTVVVAGGRPGGRVRVWAVRGARGIDMADAPAGSAFVGIGPGGTVGLARIPPSRRQPDAEIVSPSIEAVTLNPPPPR